MVLTPLVHRRFRMRQRIVAKTLRQRINCGTRRVHRRIRMQQRIVAKTLRQRNNCGTLVHCTFSLCFISFGFRMSSQSSLSSFQSSLSDSEEEELLLLASVLRKRRRVWVHEINQKRRKLGDNKLCLELQSHGDRFFTYFRMKPETFEYLHNLLEPHIKKNNTNYREAITTKERLALCLR